MATETKSPNDVSTYAGFLAEYDSLFEHYKRLNRWCHSAEGYAYSEYIPPPGERRPETVIPEAWLNDYGREQLAASQVAKLDKIRKSAQDRILYALEHSNIGLLSAQRACRRLGLPKPVKADRWSLTVSGDTRLTAETSAAQQTDLQSRLKAAFGDWADTHSIALDSNPNVQVSQYKRSNDFKFEEASSEPEVTESDG